MITKRALANDGTTRSANEEDGYAVGVNMSTLCHLTVHPSALCQNVESNVHDQTTDRSSVRPTNVLPGAAPRTRHARPDFSDERNHRVIWPCPSLPSPRRAPCAVPVTIDGFGLFGQSSLPSLCSTTCISKTPCRLSLSVSDAFGRPSLLGPQALVHRPWPARAPRWHANVNLGDLIAVTMFGNVQSPVERVARMRHSQISSDVAESRRCISSSSRRNLSVDKVCQSY